MIIIIIFAGMKSGIPFIVLFVLLCFPFRSHAQDYSPTSGYKVAVGIYKGDTIPSITLRDIYIYPPLRFKNKHQEQQYNKLVRDVKIVFPIAREVNRAVIETYEYLQTLPDEKSRSRHIRQVEKSIKQQYTPRMKKLTFSQGKLLIKLVNRECNQSSYQLVKAFMGPFKATFYQAFASLFGASLKKEYHPEDEDRMVERVVTLVENGQL